MDRDDVGGVREVAVRFHDHGDAGGRGVRGQRPEPLGDAREHRLARLARRDLIAEDPDVLHAHRVRQVDEAPAFVERRLSRRARQVHGRGGAQVGDGRPRWRQGPPACRPSGCR